MGTRIVFIAAVVAAGMFFGGCQVNPVTGKEEFNIYSPQQQKQMGAYYAKEVDKEDLKNPEVQNYINSVGQKVAAVSQVSGEGFVYKAVNDKSVNAFALPGGYIYITTGMLKQLTTESQLAAVLAHETAHVAARHAAVGMSRDLLISAGANILASGSSGASQAVGIIKDLEGMRYTRGQERQADEIGLDYLVKAEYSPKGMVETMEVLNRQSGGRTFEFLSTHPNPDHRIRYIQEDIYNKNYTAYESTGRVGSEDYKAHVLSKL